MTCMSQNFRLFHVSNLSVRNFRIFLLMYTGSIVDFTGVEWSATSKPARWPATEQESTGQWAGTTPWPIVGIPRPANPTEARLTLHTTERPPETITPVTRASKDDSLERINSLREINLTYGSGNSCKLLVPSRLHELHESKRPLASLTEFINLKLYFYLLM